MQKLTACELGVELAELATDLPRINVTDLPLNDGQDIRASYEIALCSV